MRSIQEFRGQSTRLDYDRERGEFVARPEPHPFTVTKPLRDHVQRGRRPQRLAWGGIPLTLTRG